MGSSNNPQRIQIDLSGRPKKNFENIFFQWAVHAGRIIIVVTELIALGALMYRFAIDRQITDLHDQIRKQEVFVKAQKDKEERYRSIQERLTLIKRTNQETASKLAVMEDLLAKINNGTFTATNLIIFQNTITIDGGTFTIFQLNSAIDELVKKHKDEIQSLGVNEINSTPLGIKFKLTVELKKELENLL